MLTKRLLIIVLLTLGLVACARNQDAPATTNVDVIEGTVGLPQGVDIQNEALQIVNSVSEVSVNNNWQFTSSILKASRQFSVLVGESGNPILLAWLDKENTDIDSRSTAEVLLYFAIGGYALPLEIHEDLVAIIRNMPELDLLENTIYESLEKNIDALTTSTEIYESIRTILSTILDVSDLASQGIIVDPQKPASGISIDTSSGINTIILENFYRRRSRFFIEQTAYTDQAGSVIEINPAKQIADFDLDPVNGLKTVVATATDIILGNPAFDPQRSQEYVLPLDPPDSRKVTYRVTAVGFGANSGDFLRVTDVQGDAQVLVAMEQALFDFVMPAVLDIIGGAKGLSSKDFASELITTKPVIQALALEILRSSPAIGEKIAAGDSTYISDVVKIVFQNDVILKRITGYLVDEVILEKFPNAPINGSNVINIARLLKIADIAFITIDLGIMASDLANSDRANIWTIEISPAEVLIEPEDSTLQFDEELTLTARIKSENSDDSSLVYRWKLNGKSNSEPVGRIFDDERQERSIRYKSLFDNGEDQISVEVWQKTQEGALYKVGESEPITIKVDDETQVEINIPFEFIGLNDSLSGANAITATLLGDVPDGEVSYKWTTTGEFGSLSTGTQIGKTVESQLSLVNYLSGDEKEGTDTITVEVFVTNNGEKVSLGKDGGEVTVEDYGSISVSPDSLSRTLDIEEEEIFVFTVASERVLPVSYEARIINEPNFVQITSGATGVVNEDQNGIVTVTAKCPTESGSYRFRIDFTYYRADGTDFPSTDTDSFTPNVDVILDCVDGKIVKNVDIKVHQSVFDAESYYVDTRFVFAPEPNAERYLVTIKEHNPSGSPTFVGRTFSWEAGADNEPLASEGEDAGNYVISTFISIGPNASVNDVLEFARGVTGRAEVIITLDSP